MDSESSKSGVKATPLSTAAKLDVLAHGLHALERSAQGTAAPATPAAAAAAPAPAAPAAGPAPVADTRAIKFTVSNATATLRITMVDDPAHPEVVVPAGATTGTSSPRPNNTLIDIIVELLGSAGNSADIAITNVDTPNIHPSIPNNFTGSWYPIQYTLKTKW